MPCFSHYCDLLSSELIKDRGMSPLWSVCPGGMGGEREGERKGSGREGQARSLGDSHSALAVWIPAAAAQSCSHA